MYRSRPGLTGKNPNWSRLLPTFKSTDGRIGPAASKSMAIRVPIPAYNHRSDSAIGQFFSAIKNWNLLESAYRPRYPGGSRNSGHRARTDFRDIPPGRTPSRKGLKLYLWQTSTCKKSVTRWSYIFYIYINCPIPGIPGDHTCSASTWIAQILDGPGCRSPPFCTKNNWGLQQNDSICIISFSCSVMLYKHGIN